MFPQPFLEALRERVCLSEIIQHAQIHLVRKGRYFLGLCPFHTEKTPSFTVHDDQGYYHCFGCGERGDAIDFIRQREGICFEEAVKSLATQVGLTVPEKTPSFLRVDRDVQVKFEALDMASQWFQAQLCPHVLSYLALRGITQDQQKDFRLGWAPSGTPFIQKALAEGHTLETLENVGLIRRTEQGHVVSFFQNRLMFPIFNAKSQVIGFGARTLGEEMPKYLNSPQTSLFYKAKAFYHRPKFAHPRAKILLVEGYFDVIASCQDEIFACAPLGTSLNGPQLLSLWKKTDAPIIGMDGDKAGLAAQWRIAKMALPLLKSGQNLLFMNLPSDHDPHSFIQTYGQSAFLKRAHQAIPLSTFLWETLFKDCYGPEERAKANAQWHYLTGTLKDPSLASFFKDYGDDRLRLLRQKNIPLHGETRRLPLPPIPGEAFYHKLLFGILFLEPDLIEELKELLTAMTLDPKSSWWQVRKNLLLWNNGESFENCFEKTIHEEAKKDLKALIPHIPREKAHLSAYWCELFNAYQTYVHQKEDVARLKLDLFRTPQAWERLKILTQL